MNEKFVLDITDVTDFFLNNCVI